MSTNAKETALRRQKQLLSHLKGESAETNPKEQIKQVAVYGAGIMGGGIAQVVAQAGYKVTLWDIQQSDIDRGMQTIRNSLERLSKKQEIDPTSVLRRISTTTSQIQAAHAADLVIEAIVEDLKTKQQLLERLDKVAKPSCIFATNTSSLLVRDIAKTVSGARKARTVALHFFNPVAIMQLVEIANADGALLDLLKAFVRDIGKVPVVCRDTPGFIVNRLLVPYNNEARQMVERGDASIEDVDTAMRLGAGYPMGPFELMDMTGIDVGYHIMKGWYEGASGLQGDPRFKPSKEVEQMIKKNHLGHKTGRGYYTYTK
ncbi:3-hydroxyacyl-CoA dehydrogenase [Coemansia spiralis]|nr:3-hydroxyacyl-CoA dehydrogenase [Coemansia spiralis]